jgi:hypothetical protein
VPGTTLNPSRVEVFTSIYPAINYHISFFLSFVGYVGAVPGTRGRRTIRDEGKI